MLAACAVELIEFAAGIAVDSLLTDERVRAIGFVAGGIFAEWAVGHTGRE